MTKLRTKIWRRAKDCCEYCRLPQSYHANPFALDHIRPQSHDGPTTFDNLALACFDCNTFKGTNVAGFDPETDEIVRLFHPRVDAWSDHFSFDGGSLRGKTPIGRTTVFVLRFNTPERVRLRNVLVNAGALDK